MIFVEISNDELLDKKILVHLVEQDYMDYITPYCYFTRTVKLNDIISDDEYGVTFYHFEVPNTGEIAEVMVKNPIVVDAYKVIKFEKGKYYDFIYDNVNVQYNDIVSLLELSEPYKIVLSENIKNESVCENNKLYIKERIITNEDYSFMFYEDDSYKYYFKNYCLNIFIINDKEYTFAEVIENGYLTFDDIDRSGYKYNKLKK